ncbi:MAG: hypothetical protein M3405_14860 [Acidobacteriota bacterium]|nr:hypothetical protein [Acidobacteriota bacterium]
MFPFTNFPFSTFRYSFKSLCFKVVEALVQACADGQIGIGRVRLNDFKSKSEQKEAA